MAEQDIFGGNRRVGLEREGPFAVTLLHGDERGGGGAYRIIERARGPAALPFPLEGQGQ